MLTFSALVYQLAICQYTKLLRVSSHTGDAGLAEALITGGLPPAIDEPCGADTVYTATYQRVYTQNRKFYQRFPEDIAKVKAIVRLLKEAPGGGVKTPGGNMLRPRSLQMLGMSSVLTPKHYQKTSPVFFFRFGSYSKLVCRKRPINYHSKVIVEGGGHPESVQANFVIVVHTYHSTALSVRALQNL